MKAKQAISLILIASLLTSTAGPTGLEAFAAQEPPAAPRAAQADGANSCSPEDMHTLVDYLSERRQDYREVCTAVNRQECNDTMASCDDRYRFPLLHSALSNRNLVQNLEGGVQTVHCGNIGMLLDRADDMLEACVTQSRTRIEPELTRLANQEPPCENCTGDRQATVSPADAAGNLGALGAAIGAAGGGTPEAEAPACQAVPFGTCLTKDKIMCAIGGAGLTALLIGGGAAVAGAATAGAGGLASAAATAGTTGVATGIASRAGRCGLGGAQCVAEMVSGFLKGMWFNIRGLFWDLPKLVLWTLPKAAVTAAWRGARSLFSGTQRVESRASDAQLQATGMSQADLAQARRDGGRQHTEGVLSRFLSWLDTSMSTYTCERWTGAPYVSACAQNSGRFTCANCRDKVRAICGASSFIVSQFIGTGLLFGVAARGAQAAAATGRAAQIARAAAGINSRLPAIVQRGTAAAGRGTVRAASAVSARVQRFSQMLQRRREARIAAENYLREARASRLAPLNAALDPTTVSRLRARYGAYQDLAKARTATITAQQAAATAAREAQLAGKTAAEAMEIGQRAYSSALSATLASATAPTLGKTVRLIASTQGARATDSLFAFGRGVMNVFDRGDRIGMRMGEAAMWRTFSRETQAAMVRQGMAPQVGAAFAAGVRAFHADGVVGTGTRSHLYPRGMQIDDVAGVGPLDSPDIGEVAVTMSREEQAAAAARAGQTDGVTVGTRTDDATDQVELGLQCNR